MNQAQEFHNQQLAAQEVLAAQASDQRDETNKLLLSAVNVLTEQLEYMKNAGYRVGGMPENKAFGGFVHRFSSGGRVPGVGNEDKVRALLTPGEFVIEKNVANRYYSELERLNERGAIDGNDMDTGRSGAIHTRSRTETMGVPGRNTDDVGERIRPQDILVGTRRDIRRRDTFEDRRRGSGKDGNSKGTYYAEGGNVEYVVSRPVFSKSDIEYINELQQRRYNRGEKQQEKPSWERVVAMQMRSFREASPQQQQRYLDRVTIQPRMTQKEQMHASLENPGNPLRTLMGVSDVISGSIGEVATLGTVPYFTNRKEQGRNLMVASSYGNTRIREETGGQWADAIGAGWGIATPLPAVMPHIPHYASIRDIPSNVYTNWQGKQIGSRYRRMDGSLVRYGWTTYRPVADDMYDSKLGRHFNQAKKDFGTDVIANIATYTSSEGPLINKAMQNNATDTLSVSRRKIGKSIVGAISNVPVGEDVIVYRGTTDRYNLIRDTLGVDGLRLAYNQNPEKIVDIINDQIVGKKVFQPQGIISTTTNYDKAQKHSAGEVVYEILANKKTPGLAWRSVSRHPNEYEVGLKSMQRFEVINAKLLDGVRNSGEISPIIIRMRAIPDQNKGWLANFLDMFRSEGGLVHKFATGGRVPGIGNKDTIPAMLTPDEFVVRAPVAKKYGSFLTKLNNGGIPQVQSGVNYNKDGGKNYLWGLDEEDRDMALQTARMQNNLHSESTREGAARWLQIEGEPYRNSLVKQQGNFDKEISSQYQRIAAGKPMRSWTDFAVKGLDATEAVAIGVDKGLFGGAIQAGYNTDAMRNLTKMDKVEVAEGYEKLAKGAEYATIGASMLVPGGAIKNAAVFGGINIAGSLASEAMRTWDEPSLEEVYGMFYKNLPNDVKEDDVTKSIVDSIAEHKELINDPQYKFYGGLISRMLIAGGKGLFNPKYFIPTALREKAAIKMFDSGWFNWLIQQSTHPQKLAEVRPWVDKVLTLAPVIPEVIAAREFIFSPGEKGGLFRDYSMAPSHMPGVRVAFEKCSVWHATSAARASLVYHIFCCFCIGQEPRFFHSFSCALIRFLAARSR